MQHGFVASQELNSALVQDSERTREPADRNYPVDMSTFALSYMVFQSVCGLRAQFSGAARRAFAGPKRLSLEHRPQVAITGKGTRYSASRAKRM